MELDPLHAVQLGPLVELVDLSMQTWWLGQQKRLFPHWLEEEQADMQQPPEEGVGVGAGPVQLLQDFLQLDFM